MQRDANMLVPDAQQPPADQDNDIGDPCPEDDEFFDRPNAFGCVEWESQLFRGVMHAMLSLQSAKEAPDKHWKEASDGSKDDGA